MKQLNSHLESRLEVQERRLCLVTSELSKTWHVVSRLRKHHHQLHTHEKILKYELQQKRKLLNELKEELEYCREKLEQAREKNTQSEKDWKNLRAEFTSRKTKSSSASVNNSAESGYSDEKASDESSESNDEREYPTKSLIRIKKKHKKSSETIMDSSADFNLIAEREDPASDILDIADLPLDTHDGDNNQENTSDDRKYQISIKTTKTNDETEDELCDINHDNASPEESISQPKCGIVIDSNTESKSNISNESPDNEIDKQSTNETTFDNLIDNPKSSNNNLLNVENNKADNPNPYSSGKDDIKTDNCNLIESDFNFEDTEESLAIMSPSQIFVNSINDDEKDRNVKECMDSTDDKQYKEIQNKDNSDVPLTDLKKILDNVKQQNERLSKKDERLQNLEANCSDLVKTLSDTLKTGEEISEKLNVLHIKHENCKNENETNSVHNTDDYNDLDASETANELTEPSTSSEIDHEARFAARDRRLKKLEEQTKSLVTKVNKTTSKGVKINYKLEELHSIYGSESSRAGTPSEDIEDKSIESETNHESE